MSRNKIIFFIAFFAIILGILVPTVVKVRERYQDRLYDSVVSKIIFNAKKCHNEKKCQGDRIYLKDLYNLDYLDKIINPETNEYFNENDYVLVDNYEFKKVD